MTGFPIRLTKYGDIITVYNVDAFKAKTSDGYTRIEEKKVEIKQTSKQQETKPTSQKQTFKKSNKRKR